MPIPGLSAVPTAKCSDLEILKIPTPSSSSHTLAAYPKGIWGAYGNNPILSPDLIANKGVVGVAIQANWNDVNPFLGVYNWTDPDNRIAQAKAAGFKIVLNFTASSAFTPQWVLDLLPDDQKILLLDLASSHPTYCGLINTALYWNSVYHSARIGFMNAAGTRYSHDRAIVGTIISFANHHSGDWNIQDFNGTFPDCGGVTVDQPQQWVDAGWTEALMLQVGKDIMDAAAIAWPRQYLKLPIGGIGSSLMNGGDFTTLARDLDAYIYSRPYANRIYEGRQVFTCKWPNAEDLADPPITDSENYLRWMIREHAKPSAPFPGHATVQCEFPATTCDLLDGETDCGTGTCDATKQLCTMNLALIKALTYHVDAIEVVNPDAKNNLGFGNLFYNTTLAMGGKPRPGTHK